MPALARAPHTLPAAALIGIDWGTTHRRVQAFDARGEPLRETSDDDGMLNAAGRFAASLAAALERVGPLAGSPRVLLSGMVGSAQGWHEVPYLDTSVPLPALGRHLFRVPDAGAAIDCRIVPGYRWRGGDGCVDVMRGEETQLLGAVALGHRDGWFVLPGTHSKWVRLRDARIERFATYMSGELFALLSQHGTLAPLLRDVNDAADPSAFADGVRAAEHAALSHALFGCRAAVVAGDMPRRDARDYMSGLLIGAEWHDATRRLAADRAPLHVLGSAELSQRHLDAAAVLGVPAGVIDAPDAQRAAWRMLHGIAAGTE